MDPPIEDEPLLDEKQNKPRLQRTKKIQTTGVDSLWSWVVAFANFLVNFIIVGLGRMSSIFYVVFMDIFNVNRQMASVPFSVQQAARNFFAPVAGIIGQKYGVRSVTIAGGIIGAISAGASYFIKDITWITITWGLMFGVSTALTITLNQVSIDQHFEKHRGTAGGLAFSGGCVGAFFFPVVLEALLVHYGMKDTFLVMAVIILGVVPAAVLMREPSWMKDNLLEALDIENETKPDKTIYGTVRFRSQPNQDAKCDLTYSSGIESDNTKHYNSFTISEALKNAPIHRNDTDFRLLRMAGEIVYHILTMELEDDDDFQNSQKLANSTRTIPNKNQIRTELEKIYVFLERQRLDNQTSSSENADGQHDSSQDRGNISETENNNMDDESPVRIYIYDRLKKLYDSTNLELVSRFPRLHPRLILGLSLELKKVYEHLMGNESKSPMQKTASDSTFDPLKNNRIRKKRKRNKDQGNTFRAHIQTAIKLHGNPMFLLISLCRAVFMLTFVPVVTVIVDFAMDKGLKRDDGKYLISILSLGDFLGRLCLGWVTDRGCLSQPRYMLVAMILLGASTASLPFMHNKVTIFSSILVFGVLQGSLFVRHPMLVSKYTDSHEKAIGMGFINLLSGFIGFALPAFIGYFRDTLGSYDKMFYANGAICAAIGLMWCLEPCLVRFMPSNHVSNGKI